MVKAYLGFGSNLGDRKANIDKALSELARDTRYEVKQVSSMYETDPVGVREQPKFLNAVAEIETDVFLPEFLDTIKRIEETTGREKTFKWGPRVIDIDILLYGDEHFAEENLEVPHPEMHKRAFVLVPLAEIAPLARHPVLGFTVEQMSAGVGSEGVRKHNVTAGD